METQSQKRRKEFKLNFIEGLKVEVKIKYAEAD